jgi:hypothetical protein
MIGRRRVQRGESVLFGQAMVGGELKTSTTHFLVVLEIRTAAFPPALLDVVGKNPTQPQRVVSEVRPYEKASARVRIVDVSNEPRERAVDFVGGRHAMRAVAKAEMND